MERGEDAAAGCRYQGWDPILGSKNNKNCTGEVGLHAFAKKLSGDGNGWATATRQIWDILNANGSLTCLLRSTSALHGAIDLLHSEDKGGAPH